MVQREGMALRLFYLSDEQLGMLHSRARGNMRRLARLVRDVYAGEAADVLVLGPEDGAFEVRKANRKPFRAGEVMRCLSAQLKNMTSG